MKPSKFGVVVVLVIVFVVSACSSSPAATVIPTDAPKPTASHTSTPAPLPTETHEPTITASPTIVPTSESAAMEGLIEQLYEKKAISSTEGTYRRLADFSENWAQLYYYKWWYTDFSPSNFVIQADMEWESASKTPNLGESGCGFVYHTSAENKDHHATFLTMDGYVKTNRILKNVFTPLKSGYAGKFKIPADKAHMVLIVDKQWITAIVNDKQVVHFQDPKLPGGKIGLTLVSGTNKDFGIRCTIKNIELWELPE